MYLIKNNIFHWIYLHVIKPIFFLMDAETAHDTLTHVGSFLGNFSVLQLITKKLFYYQHKKLSQTIAKINFANPIGLSAGFDYQAKLTQILPMVGFGFETVGTITNHAYAGNKKPRLGRLIKSKSLLVNKGFKNEGIVCVINKLQRAEGKEQREFPVGISIGMTNSRELTTVKESIEDIVAAFIVAEKFGKFSYYEMNISCPNLHSPISFYSPKNLSLLLSALKKLKLSKPLFIKMPINNTDKEIKDMLDVITKFSVRGVIFGNLQKDRANFAFDPDEILTAGKGGFSGKPTQKRSDELIALTYKHYGKKLIIIGCGGVFSAEDAYRKIRLGASLVQLITGMIFEGPQMIGRINYDLVNMLERDGFNNISEAVGKGIYACHSERSRGI
jgi:dihydroorotate dehydrogenase